VARRKCNNPIAPVVEEWIGTDKKRADALLVESRKGRIEILFAAGCQDPQTTVKRPYRRLRLAHDGFRAPIVRVHKHGDDPGLRN